MPFTKIYIHLVFGTKKREQILEPGKRQVLIDHIRKNAVEKAIQIDSVNGHDDHLHFLIRLHPTQNIADIAKLIKGESASWANKNNIFTKTLQWAVGYYAASVDGEDFVRVKNYIFSQEARHFMTEQYLKNEE